MFTLRAPRLQYNTERVASPDSETTYLLGDARSKVDEDHEGFRKGAVFESPADLAERMDRRDLAEAVDTEASATA